MGQAKQRGTFEERRLAALDRNRAEREAMAAREELRLQRLFASRTSTVSHRHTTLLLAAAAMAGTFR